MKSDIFLKKCNFFKLNRTFLVFDSNLYKALASLVVLNVE